MDFKLLILSLTMKVIKFELVPSPSLMFISLYTVSYDRSGNGHSLR